MNFIKTTLSLYKTHLYILLINNILYTIDILRENEHICEKDRIKRFA